MISFGEYFYKQMNQKPFVIGISGGSGEAGGSGRAVGGCGSEALVGAKEQSWQLGAGVAYRQPGEGWARPEGADGNGN